MITATDYSPHSKVQAETFKLLVAFCKALDVKRVTATEDHQRANGQVKRFKVTMVSILRQYVAKGQKNWDMSAFSWRTRETYRSTKATVYPTSAWQLLDYRPDLRPSKFKAARSRRDWLTPRLPKTSLPRSCVKEKIADKAAEKAQALYRRNYDNPVRFDPHFAASVYVFVEFTLFMTCAADRMEYEGYLDFFPRRTGP